MDGLGTLTSPRTAPPRRIGLTGGIGSGKSVVAAMLAQLGAAIVDTDAIAHRLTMPGGAALPDLVAAFGPGILAAQGGMDRARMRALAFSDPSARQRLQAILHPLIATEARRQGESHASAPAVVYDIPLLTESTHWRDWLERVLVIDCSEATQIERVARRSGWPPEQVRAVIAAQASREARRAIADAVILNDGISLDDLRQRVSEVWRDWRLPM